jgi:intracellular sulfur oxidation DsrE/DsrF family protein
MRRRFFKNLLAGMLVIGMSAMAIGSAWAEQPIKVVYDVSQGLEQASRALANIRNELIAEPNTKVVLVTHGEGIKFLLDGAVDSRGRSYEAIVSALASQGVEFRVCNNTLNAFNIEPSKVILEAKVVPSGVAEVARLQAREGYVYIHP